MKQRKLNCRLQNDRARYPSPALLRVSKMIGAEARSILYSKNQWRLPLDMNISVSMFTQHPNLFRSIVVAFDQRDVSPTIKAQISKREHSSTDYEGVAKIAAARARKVHKRLLEAQERVCIHAWRLLSVMGQLRSLLVELEDFACPSGCCREKLMTRAGVLDCWFLYHLKAKQMNKRQKRGMIVPQISVRGLLSQSERVSILFTAFLSLSHSLYCL